MPKRSDIESTRQNTEGLALLANKLGYRSRFGQLQFNNGATASDLFEFFDDNPGACEAVVEWVLENRGDVEDDSEEESDNLDYETVADCIKHKAHLTIVDDDGYCNHCGHQAEADDF